MTHNHPRVVGQDSPGCHRLVILTPWSGDMSRIHLALVAPAALAGLEAFLRAQDA